MSISSVESALCNHSTDKYFIEYNGFLSNHLAHGIIALHRLGASEERIQRFIEWYTPKLEPPTYDESDTRSFEELKGERVAFYSILKHYQELLKNKFKNVDELIRNEYPKVSAGLSGSALHGTIHIGYGYSVKSEKIVLEGLAYTYHSFRPLVTTRTDEELATFGNGTTEIIDALATLRSKKDLIPMVLEAIKEDRWKPLKLGRFQLSVVYLLSDHGDLLTDLMLSLKLEHQVRGTNGAIDAIKLSRRVAYWAVTVYACAEPRNNFFLLHGVTCAWALTQILPMLDNEDGVKVMREFLCVLLAVYVAEGCSDLTATRITGPFSDQDWNDIVTETVGVDRDEHCYKLVHVCYEMAKDAEVHGEDPDIYMQAARSAIDHELAFYNE